MMEGMAALSEDEIAARSRRDAAGLINASPLRAQQITLTDYHFAWPGLDLPPIDQSKLLDYVLAQNGVFARGKRPGLEVSMPISFNLQPIRGLQEAQSYVKWGFPKVPSSLLEGMISISRDVCSPSPREALFYLTWSLLVEPGQDQIDGDGGWKLYYPDQDASDQSVRAVDGGFGSSNEHAVIELHSHHEMPADFSETDDEAETGGFRIYTVIGRLFSQPEIRARVGLWGHYWEFPAREFFELPNWVRDCVA
jgi:PRTRC genetic system protein A